MKDSLGERGFYTVNFVILTAAGLVCLLPLLHILAVSLSSNTAIATGKVSLWPVEPSWRAYASMIEGTNIVRAFQNSLFITAAGTAFNMLLTILAAYPLSKRQFYLRRFFTLSLVFTMLFKAGLIPDYMLVKSLHLVDSYWALWLPGLISVYNMLLLRSFFTAIPEELEDAARMDGCSEWKLILRIILPLSLPVIATLTLFYGVAHWNSFFNVMIYINDSNKYNLSVLVQNMIQSSTLLTEMSNLNPEDYQMLTPESIKSASVIVMTLPMLVIYPFLQKYFVKGVMLGAVKG
ncbi:carbohydrate ABC transporter permease [Paenibacillus sp. J5C_2022]|uniref:carbohydrate ABC transporter permease n=1 Tax=Paenibacillus sp. J5C2022 TaxID=2977129 RepID=UPI0021D29008|nr:carbohydrate ABC transporter permease [Paenibacillus sp. J5C2022]MCU6711419.1 carbohydrate ABC transporter permease [Paenibacillus sp. J5C2022]